MFLLQALFCYVPQWLWNNWEGGLMQALVMGLNYGIDEKENIEKKKNTLMEYLRLHIKVSNCIKIH